MKQMDQLPISVCLVKNATTGATTIQSFLRAATKDEITLYTSVLFCILHRWQHKLRRYLVVQQNFTIVSMFRKVYSTSAFTSSAGNPPQRVR